MESTDIIWGVVAIILLFIMNTGSLLLVEVWKDRRGGSSGSNCNKCHVMMSNVQKVLEAKDGDGNPLVYSSRRSERIQEETLKRLSEVTSLIPSLTQEIRRSNDLQTRLVDFVLKSKGQEFP